MRTTSLSAGVHINVHRNVVRMPDGSGLTRTKSGTTGRREIADLRVSSNVFSALCQHTLFLNPTGLDCNYVGF